MLQMDYPEEDFGMWTDAWIIPCIFVTASTVAYLLLLSVNPLPHRKFRYYAISPEFYVMVILSYVYIDLTYI